MNNDSNSFHSQEATKNNNEFGENENLCISMNRTESIPMHVPVISNHNHRNLLHKNIFLFCFYFCLFSWLGCWNKIYLHYHIFNHHTSFCLQPDTLKLIK